MLYNYNTFVNLNEAKKDDTPVYVEIKKGRYKKYCEFINDFLEDIGIETNEILGIEDNPEIPSVNKKTIKVIPFTENTIKNSKYLYRNYTLIDKNKNLIMVTVNFNQTIEDDKLYLYFSFQEFKNTRQTKMPESSIDKKIRLDKKAKEQEAEDLEKMKKAGIEQGSLF